MGRTAGCPGKGTLALAVRRLDKRQGAVDRARRPDNQSDGAAELSVVLPDELGARLDAARHGAMSLGAAAPRECGSRGSQGVELGAGFTGIGWRGPDSTCPGRGEPAGKPGEAGGGTGRLTWRGEAKQCAAGRSGANGERQERLDEADGSVNRGRAPEACSGIARGLLSSSALFGSHRRRSQARQPRPCDGSAFRARRPRAAPPARFSRRRGLG